MSAASSLLAGFTIPLYSLITICWVLQGKPDGDMLGSQLLTASAVLLRAWAPVE